MPSIGIPTDTNLFVLPDLLPAPEDDGAARHLRGAWIPSISLRSTRGRLVDIAEESQHLSVFFFYPATVKPGVPIPGEWSEIPGARGCTVQNCAFRDVFSEFQQLNCRVFGVSGQGQDPDEGLDEQREFADRVHLPFEL
ncbi:MAG: peroxiredoxin, partial [Thermoplasmata archaeon]